MRLTVVLLIVGALHVSASVYSQSQIISFSNKELTMREVFKEIEKQSKFRFFYNDVLTNIDKPVVLSSNNLKIDNILQILLNGTNLSYKILENNLIIISPVVLLQQQEISGVVTDGATGEPIIGANVIVEGTTLGVVTDVNGKFTLEASKTDIVLAVSFLGYKTERISVNGQANLNIKLTPDVTNLEEIVVVGYGTQKRGSVTGSVTSISSKDIENLPAGNLSTMLAGRLSGVLISQGTGKPGTSASFSIRAQGTINNYDPLYVIDGIVRDKFAFDGLDPSEVENISVLKDGASAAVYGSRAANGVVLITTKKGKMGKPQINYSGSFGLETPAMIPETLSAYEHAVYLNDGAWASYITNPATNKVDPRTLSTWYTDDELEYFKTTDYNWLRDAWKTPVSSRHTLNVSGGSEAVRYFVGGSYYYATGSFDNLKYNKYNLRASIEADVTKNLTASLNLSADKRMDEKPYWSPDKDEDRMADLYKGLLLRTKFIPSYINGYPVGNLIEWHPLMQISKESGEHIKKWNDLSADITLEYRVPWVKGLKFKVLYSKSLRNRLIKQVSMPYNMYEFKVAGTNSHYIDPVNELSGKLKLRANPSFVKKENQLEEDYQLNTYLTYDFAIGKHNFNALFVYEQAEESSDRFDAQRNNLVTWSLPEFFAASSESTNQIVGAGSVTEGGRLSYVGRLNYSYADKYLLELSFREDGSTKFAPDKRWGFFPSVSAGWRISNEQFFKDNLSFIDYLKIKGSFATLGNDAVGGWQWMPRNGIVTDATKLAVFENVQLGIEPKELANPNLTWEKSRSYNTGFESQWFKNRITLGFEYFYRQTYDILDTRTVSLPTTFGAKMPKENYSAIDSKGIEVELGYNSNMLKSFKYYVRGNFSYARSWWVKRDEAINQRSYLSEIGQPIGRVWGYDCTGIIRTQEDLDAIKQANPAMKVLGIDPVLGMLMYRDVRGVTSDDPDGIITTDDKVVIIQNAKPTMTYGLNLGAQWKGFTLDLFFQGLAGHKKMISLGLGGINAFTNTFKWKADHWTPENPNASQPSAQGNKNGENSTFWVRNASFLRLKNATLAYEIPSKLSNKVGINKLNVFVTGTNLFLLIDHIKWMDPEATNLTDYPVMKNFSLGININL